MLETVSGLEKQAPFFVNRRRKRKSLPLAAGLALITMDQDRSASMNPGASLMSRRTLAHARSEQSRPVSTAKRRHQLSDVTRQLKREASYVHGNLSQAYMEQGYIIVICDGITKHITVLSRSLNGAASSYRPSRE
jgi:hypothetical protein